MEEKAYLAISTKLDRIIKILEGLTHTKPTPIHRGIEMEKDDPDRSFCTCGNDRQTAGRIPCPIHGGG